MVESSRLVCRFGHVLHRHNSTLMKHSQTGKTWIRCLICHAARQRKARRKREQNQMSKRDYEFFAAIIRRALANLPATEQIGVEAVITQACETFTYENPRFNEAMFRKACVPKDAKVVS